MSEVRRPSGPRGLEVLAEESSDSSLPRHRFPGGRARRAWVIGTGLDVWEVVELYEGKGRERLLSEHSVSERHLTSLSYREAYPREIDEALEENARTPEEARTLPVRRAVTARD